MTGLAHSDHTFAGGRKEAIKMTLVSQTQGTAKGLESLLFIQDQLVGSW